MQCPKCKSKNVNIQMVTETKLKNKHHSIFYWLFGGWVISLFINLLEWFFLTIPKLLAVLFLPKKKEIINKHNSMAVCQNCGHHWNI